MTQRQKPTLLRRLIGPDFTLESNNEFFSELGTTFSASGSAPGIVQVPGLPPERVAELDNVSFCIRKQILLYQLTNRLGGLRVTRLQIVFKPCRPCVVVANHPAKFHTHRRGIQVTQSIISAYKFRYCLAIKQKITIEFSNCLFVKARKILPLN